MRRSNIISVAAIAALIFGCSDQPAPTSVTGSGHEVWAPEFGGNAYIRIFTDVAHRYEDGTVDGHWERVPTGPWLGDAYPARGVVTCMRIEGNQAWLGGYATSGVGSENPPYNEVGWFVIDNGQGAKAEPDIMSRQWIYGEPGFAENFCATGLPPAPVPPSHILHGNIQVNP
jgi:hypothetical protein